VIRIQLRPLLRRSRALALASMLVPALLDVASGSLKRKAQASHIRKQNLMVTAKMIDGRRWLHLSLLISVHPLRLARIASAAPDAGGSLREIFKFVPGL
jgi:hypothetical protein